MFSPFVWSVILMSLRVSNTLTIFPPPSPVYLGTTTRITWTSGPGDPSSFSLSAQCAGTLATPSVNAVTADGELFVQLPSFLDFDVAVPCRIIGKTNGANGTLLSQSAAFNLVLQDPSNVNPSIPPTQLSTPSSTRMHSTIARSSSSTALSPSISNLLSSTGASGVTIALSSLIVKSRTTSITVSFSTVTPQISSSVPSSTMSSSTQTQTSIATGDAASMKKKIPIGTIVGASVGGFLVICALVITLILYKQRRRHSELPILEPLAYTATPSSGQGSSRIGEFSGLIKRKTSDSLRQKDDQGLHLLVQQMSERIRVLETQQSESREVLLSGYEHGQAPPDYSDRGRTPLPLSRAVSPSAPPPASHQDPLPDQRAAVAEQ